MRRGFVHTIAWSLATGAAVTLSWWGVHTVMAGTAYDPPRALPLAADDGGKDRARPLSSSTHRPEPPSAKKSPTPEKSAKAPKSPKPPEPSKSRTRAPDASPPAGSGDAATGRGTVKGYSTKGGRVVFDLGEESATLVSATPAAGWSVQTWKQDKWIRVEFTAGAEKLSVFCTWHDTAPRVQINTY
ncbi:hypothetical protein GKQ77_29575 [Streptomyces sp. BG9H]|uniref:Secreted protein n=1 Tax=Streptomyces anatolicus TaxID=2675858 RepID=A0ABS6YW43_9ACTN|nr:hypothetical protein [Streptomyces anatolicus]MBW5425663.1 hypothetical protein [Streptomyces anatolicus]